MSEHKYNQNFGTLIQKVFDDVDLDDTASPEALEREEEHMQRFRYEYIIVNIGSAAYKGFGSSLKKTTTKHVFLQNDDFDTMFTDVFKKT